jgi:membrane protease YdiL (CAAX protease family)
MILKPGVSLWDALTSIEVSNAVVFVGVACTVALASEMGAISRWQSVGKQVDKGVFLAHITASIAPVLAAQACLVANPDALRSPFVVIPAKSNLLESSLFGFLAALVAIGVTLTTSAIICSVYREAEWFFDSASAQMALVITFTTAPLEEMGLRAYLYTRLKQVLAPAAASVVVGLIAAVLASPQYYYWPPFVCESRDACLMPLLYHVFAHISLSLLAGMIFERFDGAILPLVAFRVAHAVCFAALGLAEIGSYMLVLGEVGLAAFALLRPTLFQPVEDDEQKLKRAMMNNNSNNNNQSELKRD